MNKQKLKYFILGMALMIAMPTMASMFQKQLSVSTGVNIYVDKEKLNPVDANGKSVEVFLYNGTTYLPVRAISNAVGKDVYWDGRTSSVYLGKHKITEPIKEENSWIGRYDEYLINSNKQYSKDVYKKQYIPYLELNEDGTYLYYTNWLIGMAPLSGTWKVDINNSDVIHLSKANGINHEIIFEKVSENELILRGTDYVKDKNERSTSAYGDLYLKTDYLKSTNSPKISKQYHNDWALLYLDLIRCAEFKTSEFGQWYMIDNKFEGMSNVRLYDINSDNKPEIFITSRYEDECYIYSVQDRKVIFLEGIFGCDDEISVMENKKTGKKEIICTGHFNGCDTTYRLNIKDKFTVEAVEVFGRYADTLGEGKVQITYHVDGQQTNQVVYDKAIQDFNNTHKLVKKIEPYKINMTSPADKSDAVNLLIKVIDDYILKGETKE